MNTKTLLKGIQIRPKIIKIPRWRAYISQKKLITFFSRRQSYSNLVEGHTYVCVRRYEGIDSEGILTRYTNTLLESILMSEDTNISLKGMLMNHNDTYTLLKRYTVEAKDINTSFQGILMCPKILSIVAQSDWLLNNLQNN